MARVETARIEVGQRPGALDRIRTEDLVGASDERLVECILAGRLEDDRIQLYAEFAAAHDAGVDNPDGLRADYPHAWQKLLDHAAQSGSIAAFLKTKFLGKVEAYIAHMLQQQANILHAYRQARIDKDANSLPDAPELIARYQSALDNDLYKAMRALREAQKFRRETFDVASRSVEADE